MLDISTYSVMNNKDRKEYKSYHGVFHDVGLNIMLQRRPAQIVHI